MHNFYVWMERFSKKEEDKTAETFKKFGFKSSMPQEKLLTYIMRYINIKPDASILDYGAGKYPMITNYLSELGYNISAHDFKKNTTDDHDNNALRKEYDLVFAANVLNVQKDSRMLLKTLKEMKKLMKAGGSLLASIPEQPDIHKIDQEELIDLIKSIYPNAKIDKYYGQGLLIFVNY